MFKITQNTAQQFSLAAILLMAAMNEIAANRRALGRKNKPEEIYKSQDDFGRETRDYCADTN